MFWYLSFVRPPPSLYSASDRTVTTSVKIANDLRTELCEQTYIIYYSWIFREGSPVPTKLTNWRPSVEYKALDIPLPPLRPGARASEPLRLALWAILESMVGSQINDASSPFYIDLAGRSFGTLPFPVLSMPIMFTPPNRTPKARATKQEQIDRIFLFPDILGNSGAPREHRNSLVIREQTSFDLDKKIWDSGIGLSSWLSDQLFPGSEQSSNLTIARAFRSRMVSPEALHVVELGTGTGLVSLALATLFDSHPGKPPRSILATDLPSALTLIDHNIKTNCPLFPSIQIESGILDWEDESAVSAERFPSGIDLIVMADVTYNVDVFPALLRTLLALLALASSQNPLGGMNRSPPFVLLAYKERDPAERSLFECAHQLGVLFEQVGSIRGAGGASIEIYLALYHNSDDDISKQTVKGMEGMV